MVSVTVYWFLARVVYMYMHVIVNILVANFRNKYSCYAILPHRLTDPSSTPPTPPPPGYSKGYSTTQVHTAGDSDTGAFTVLMTYLDAVIYMC